VLFYFLNYHIALKISLNYIHNQSKHEIDQQLPKKVINITKQP